VDPDVYRSNWAFNAKHSLSLSFVSFLSFTIPFNVWILSGEVAQHLFAFPLKVSFAEIPLLVIIDGAYGVHAVEDDTERAVGMRPALAKSRLV